MAAVNDAPVAGRLPDGSTDPEYSTGTGRYSIATPQDVSRNGSVRAFDVDGDTLSFQVMGLPAHGTVTLDSATGSYVFTPAAGFTGNDNFVVLVSDGRGGSSLVTVAITVTPVQTPTQPPAAEPIPPVPVVDAPRPPDVAQPSVAAPAPEAPPLPTMAPFDSAVTSISLAPTASVVANPITLAMQKLADPLRSMDRIAFTDLYTSRAGFTVVVIESPQPRLSLYRGVSDQYADAGAASSFAIPFDAFAHSDPNERILLSAGLANGKSLPRWVHFDPQSGKFEIEAPDGYNGELMIKVIARDTQGREASALFRFSVGERKGVERNGRASLSEQLRQAGQRPVQALERAISASETAAAPAGKQAG